LLFSDLVNGEMTMDALHELEQLAVRAQAQEVASEARALRDRAAEGRFYVACVGQFKRGKSTLLNALVGTEVFPTGVVPVTSVPTVLRYGAPAVRIRRRTGDWMGIEAKALVDFVSEERNPGNTKEVLAVEVFVLSPLLAAGLCFVDTPGLGSVFAANTAATREFVPHLDAAPVVLGADPPLAGEELELIEAIVSELGGRADSLLFVLNKADRVSQDACREAEAFTRRILTEHLHLPVVSIFQVSALEQLQIGRADRDWTALTERLDTFARESGHGLVQSAVCRGTERLGKRLESLFNEEEAALRRPVEQSAERLERLRRTTAEAMTALIELGPLFTAEEQRIARRFAVRSRTFLAAATSRGREALSQCVKTSIRPNAILREELFGRARTIAQELVEPWLVESEGEAEAAYHKAAGHFVSLVNELLAKLRSSAGAETTLLPDAITVEEGFVTGRHFYFHQLLFLVSPADLIPTLQAFLSRVLPPNVRQKQIERRATDYLERLLVTNAARVENDIKERVLESRRQFEGKLRTGLTELVKTAEEAARRAEIVRGQGEAAVQAALTQIGERRRELAVLLEDSP
jgi:dynamin family protein